MTWLIVLAVIHVILSIAAGILCKIAHEQQVALAVTLCLIPIIGPIIIIILYCVYQAMLKAQEQSKQDQLS